MLRELLGSQCRAEILKHLFTKECKSIHLRELARLSSLSAPVLQRELRQLALLDLIIAQRDGNRVNYSANTKNPLFSLLCELVLKTEGAVGILKESFSDSSAEIIFIFGSTANGTARADSDIDLFVIGDCGLRDVAKRTHTAAEKTGKEINPYVITRIDFQNRMKKHDHFLNEIYSSPKIFLKGDENELAGLAE
ncbi:MAG: nucleotidyltransferase domain-containing protein [Victivallales bacterium]|nr:nucleotidyltransferase domain-containing protein [Victivallales bacterium]